MSLRMQVCSTVKYIMQLNVISLFSPGMLYHMLKKLGIDME